jgi:hypothetical protein
MNFFFGTCLPDVNCKLTIPKFQNSGRRIHELYLYKAHIINSKWKVSSVTNSIETDYFYQLENVDNSSVFFFGDDTSIREIEHSNELCNIESFTDTAPDFRSNLLIQNENGGFSSYQSEYPFRMTKAHGSLYSDCGLLTSASAARVGVFIRNIHFRPLNENVNIFLYSNLSQKVLETYTVKLNQTTFIDLTDWKADLRHCFLYASDFLGIPIYMIEYEDGSLSLEHTHPPHEAILGEDRFKRVGSMKRRSHEKIFKTAL